MYSIKTSCNYDFPQKFILSQVVKGNFLRTKKDFCKAFLFLLWESVILIWAKSTCCRMSFREMPVYLFIQPSVAKGGMIKNANAFTLVLASDGHMWFAFRNIYFSPLGFTGLFVLGISKALKWITWHECFSFKVCRLNVYVQMIVSNK